MYRQPDPSEAGGKVPQPKFYQMESHAYMDFVIQEREQANMARRRRELFPGGVDKGRR